MVNMFDLAKSLVNNDNIMIVIYGWLTVDKY